MLYENTAGDKDKRAELDSLLEEPNVLNPVTGAPSWWVSDEEAWTTFQK